MTSLQRLNGPFLVGVPVTLADGSSFIVPSTTTVDTSGNPVSASNPLPTRPPVQLPAAWANGSTAQDLRSFDSAQIQVVGLSGGDTIAVTRSLDGTNYVAQSVIGADFSISTSIAVDGVYSMPAGGYLKYAKTGSASTPVVTLRAGG